MFVPLGGRHKHPTRRGDCWIRPSVGGDGCACTKRSRCTMRAPRDFGYRRNVIAGLVSGVVISLTALTGGIAPAYAKPHTDPVVPTTTVPAPEPEVVAPEQPTVAEAPVQEAPKKAPVQEAPSVETPQTQAPQPPPVQTSTAAVVAPSTVETPTTVATAPP